MYIKEKNGKTITIRGVFMVVVFFIGLLFIIVTFLIIASRIGIRVDKFYVSNLESSDKFNFDVLFYIELYLFNKIKLLSIKIDKQKLIKMNQKTDLKKLMLKNIKKDTLSKKDIKEIIKKLNLELTKLDLNVKIGTEDVIITSCLIVAIVSLFSIALAKIIKNYTQEQYKYNITPIYQNKNKLKIDLNCIIKVKMVHIISIIYVLLKKRRVEKYERTSHRRSYDYSYE